jgi:hypothetical protein
MKSMPVLLVLIASVVGCVNRATFQAHDGSYDIAGQSSNPEAMAATLSANRQGELMAEGYKTAVERGSSYGYGGYMTEGGFYGMPVTVVPSTAAPGQSGQYATKSEVEAAVANGDAARDEAQEARRRADASLRMHRKLCERSGECPPSK